MPPCWEQNTKKTRGASSARENFFAGASAGAGLLVFPRQGALGAWKANQPEPAQIQGMTREARWLPRSPAVIRSRNILG